MAVRISGVGKHLPERVLTNFDLEKMVDTNDQWIISRTGIRERRIAADDDTASSMGTKASRQALATAGLTPDEALQMYTTGGAFVIHREATLGSIEPGKHADLIVLDCDPRERTPAELMDIETRATMVGGRWVHDAR